MYIFLLKIYIEVDSTEMEVVWYKTEETLYINADKLWRTTALIYVNKEQYYTFLMDVGCL